MTKPSKPKAFRSQYTMPPKMHGDLKRALLIRFASAGRKSRHSIKISGWMQEEAKKLIKKYL